MICPIFRAILPIRSRWIRRPDFSFGRVALIRQSHPSMPVVRTSREFCRLWGTWLRQLPSANRNKDHVRVQFRKGVGDYGPVARCE